MLLRSSNNVNNINNNNNNNNLKLEKEKGQKKRFGRWMNEWMRRCMNEWAAWMADKREAPRVFTTLPILGNTFTYIEGRPLHANSIITTTTKLSQKLSNLVGKTSDIADIWSAKWIIFKWEAKLSQKWWNLVEKIRNCRDIWSSPNEIWWFRWI